MATFQQAAEAARAGYTVRFDGQVAMFWDDSFVWENHQPVIYCKSNRDCWDIEEKKAGNPAHYRCHKCGLWLSPQECEIADRIGLPGDFVYCSRCAIPTPSPSPSPSKTETPPKPAHRCPRCGCGIEEECQCKPKLPICADCGKEMVKKKHLWWNETLVVWVCGCSTP